MRLNYHHLYLFWTLAEEGSFTKAAEKLSVSQSAVTAQIKTLEEALGLKLIDRSNKRKPSLTEVGSKVLIYCRTIFEAGDDLAKWALHGKADTRQTLRIGASSGLSRNFQYEFLSPLLGRSDVQVDVTSSDQERLLKLLSEHSLDLVLTSRNVVNDGRHEFYAHVLRSSPLVFVTNDQIGARSGNDRLKKALVNRPLYIPGRNFEARAELNAFMEKTRVSFRIAGEIDDTALLRVLAVRSGAVVAIPEFGVISELRSKEVFLLSRHSAIQQRYYAITRHRKFPNNLVAELIDQIRRTS